MTLLKKMFLSLVMLSFTVNTLRPETEQQNQDGLQKASKYFLSAVGTLAVVYGISQCPTLVDGRPALDIAIKANMGLLCIGHGGQAVLGKNDVWDGIKYVAHRAPFVIASSEIVFSNTCKEMLAKANIKCPNKSCSGACTVCNTLKGCAIVSVYNLGFKGCTTLMKRDGSEIRSADAIRNAKKPADTADEDANDDAESARKAWRAEVNKRPKR